MFVFPYSGFLFLLAAAAASVAWVRIRRFRLQTVIQTLATVVGQNIPLAQALRAAARYEGEKLARIYAQLAHHLEVGDTVSTALRAAYPSCPGHVIGALQGAEQSGTLPSVLRSLAADTQRERTATARLFPAVGYFVVLLMIVPTVMLAIGIFLVPKFRDILLDYGVTGDPRLELLTSLGAFVHDNAVWLAAGVLALVIVCLQATVGRHFFPRVPDRFQWIPALTDTIAWYLPILRRATETRALARQLPILQAAIRAGHDIAPAARQAACVDANYHARRRLRRWAERIERGGEPAAQARALGFPRALRSALTSARDRDELTAGLDYLCSYYRSLLAHWEHVLASAALPIVVLIWGFFVGFLVFAVFSPLYAIADGIIAEVW